jgi:hypothetical protein
MWFNSTVSEEPYQGLTCHFKRTETCDLRECGTGTARLSSARVVRCSLKWENERNPRDMLIFISDCQRLSWRKVGMTSNQRGLYALGDTRATMHRNKGTQHRKIEQILSKTMLSSDWGLQLAPMKLESLVTVNQPRHGEYVLGFCTHRPSHHGSGKYPKFSQEN